MMLTIVSVLFISIGCVSGQIYNEYACIYKDLVLNCPSPKTIYIQRADYAQWTDSCTQDCCPPAANDCFADVEKAFPQDMADLRTKCDNQTTCSVKFQGATLDNCTGVKQASYVNAYFRCLPEDPTTEPPTTEITTISTSLPPRPTISTPSTTQSPGDGGLDAGVIVGIVFGVLLLVACAILVAVIIYKKINAPPPKKGRRKPGPNQGMKVTYDNKGYASADDIQLQVIDTKQPNGIPVQTRTNSQDRPLSDGKRLSKPVTSAESIRYAKEKEEKVAGKYRTQKPDSTSDTNSSTVINETDRQKPKAKKRSKKKLGSLNDITKAENNYENLLTDSNSIKSPTENESTEYLSLNGENNDYENVNVNSQLSGENKRSS